MYKGLRLLVVVPARGGSKGVPMKNIQPVLGIPLIARVAKLVGDLEFIDDALVSSDSDEIIAMAKKYGLEAPFKRPAALSGDKISDYQVLNHALVEMEKINKTDYDVVIMLQPTSPLRKAIHIKEALDLFIEGHYQAVWSVSQSDTKNHPLKQLVIEGDTLDYYDKAGAGIIARQQLKPLYQRNGVVYIISRSCLVESKNIKGNRTGAYIVDGPSMSIDTVEDIEYVEFIMKKHGDPLDLNCTDN